MVKTLPCNNGGTLVSDDDDGVRCRPDKRGDAVGLLTKKPSSLQDENSFHNKYEQDSDGEVQWTGKKRKKWPKLRLLMFIVKMATSAAYS